MMASPLIDPEHIPGPLERNKDQETQERFIKGPPLSDSLESRTFYNAAFKLVKQGNERPLKHDDVWQLDHEHKARSIYERLLPEWEREKAKPKPSLQKAILKVFKKDLLAAFGLLFAYGCLSFINPIILPFLIAYVNDFNVPLYAGFIYIFCIIMSQLVGSYFYYLGNFRGGIVGIDIRSALVTLVYRKALTMAPQKDANSGQVVNFISSDAFFLADSFSLFIVGITAPIQIIVAIILLAIYVSYFVVITVGILLITLPIAAKIGRRFGIIRGQIQAQGDKRLKLTNELLQGIRIVKYYAWERAFQANIESFRERELGKVKVLSINRSGLIFMMQNATVLALGVTLILYGLYGAGGVTQANAFTLVAILNLVRQAFVLLPVSLSFVQQYLNSFARVQRFITQSDIVPVDVLPEPGIKLENADFKWSGAQEKTLKNINLDVKKGQLVMIVGPVGSGKSSIISAILGEIPKESGTAAVGGSIAYVAQEAYIFNSSVRENIIFGKPYDEQKYRNVLEASALMADLAQFVAGDRTEIGERGVNLSGGQKQRVAIARALYSDADVILMDDPLSAVDAHVGKHLFKKAVRGMLGDKLVLLGTNQLQYLPFADKVLFLSGGEIVAEGTFHELIKSSSAFAEQMHKYGVTGDGEAEESSEEAKPADAPRKDVSQNFSKPAVEHISAPSSANGMVATKNKKSKKSKKDNAEDAAKPSDKATLIQSEGKQSGLIGFNVYWYYFKKGSLFSFLIMILFFALSVGARVVGSWWLTVWTTGGQNSGIFLPLATYIGIYGAIIGGEILFSLGSLFMSVDFSIRASKSLHSGLLSKVIRAPTAFYDVTPLGRVINRFAKELDLIDGVLPVQFSQYLNAIFSLLGVFASMAFASPYMLIAIAAVFVAYYFFQQFYRTSYVEIQRMEALSRAPIFSQLGETLRGAATIRAYKMEENFRNVNLSVVDMNTTHRFAQKYLLAWFGLRLDGMGAVLMTALFLLIVGLRIGAPETLIGGFAALALANTAGLTPLLSTLSLNSAETEAKLNSVERIKEYDKLEQEAPEVIEENRPPKDWPSRGEVVFKDVCMRYRKGDLVLKNVSVNIAEEEKVGIVGRTGAGKSTLLQALFRMVELSSGSIEIDGIDISTIGLRDLRSKISIIPQEPVLFLGTVRYNLDPFNEHGDADLWEALGMVNLKGVIEGLDGKLDSPVEENGSNFSVGQRQLICMARALLKKTKILVMDEATASVDLDTDMLIQTMVRKNFADRTSLTIAHRLNTVMDSTKIMVLNRGELAEYDRPAALLERPETIFSSMVEATGPEQSAHLRRIANGEIGVVQSLQSLKEVSEREKSNSGEESISEEVVKAFKKSKNNNNNKSSSKSKSKSKSSSSSSSSNSSSSSSSSSDS